MAVVAASTSRLVSLSARDRRIIDLALTKVDAARVDFGDAVRALQEATDELIPDGRVFFLGTSDDRPIIGSLISGVGILEGAHGIQIVHTRDGGCSLLGWFGR